MRMRMPALFVHDSAGRIVSVNEPDGALAPRFYLGLSAEGRVSRFRHDVGADVVESLEALCRREIDSGGPPRLPKGLDEYRAVLSSVSEIEKQWVGPVYRFPSTLHPPTDVVQITETNAHLLEAGFGGWLEDVSQCQPFMAWIVEGRAVSVCCSVRITPEIHEAGVETLPEFRGHGYAAAATSTWAAAVRRVNAMPIYSTSWKNTSSQAVAKRLDLILFGLDFHIT